MREILLALPCIFLSGIANALLKWRINILKTNGITVFTSDFLKFIFDPYIFLGAIATLLSILWWLNIVSIVRISVVYPIILAGAIIVTLILGNIFLKEIITNSQFLGIMLIISGIIFLSK